MYKGCKVRIYPTEEQKILICKTFGCCRFVYNYYLNVRMKSWEENGVGLNYYDCSKALTKLKDELPFLKEVDSVALLFSLRALENAYSRFFSDLKTSKASKHPRFKRKHSEAQSYRTYQAVKYADGHVTVPKVGAIKCRDNRPLPGRISSVCISRNSAGEYYASFLCIVEQQKMLPKTGKVVGIDIGVKNLVVTSDGVKYDSPQYIYSAEKKLRRLNRRLSRKTKGSQNWEKARLAVAKAERHVANQRKDRINKITTEIVSHNDVICIEDLNVQGLTQNHTLAKRISDASFGEIVRQIKYKSEWAGRSVVAVDRFYPSSQICSNCGNRFYKARDLGIRAWRCESCGKEHDRDINAAINILNEGLRMLT